MNRKPSLLKVSLCGPGDVTPEIEIAKRVVMAWNGANIVKTGYGLECQHWPTHSAPDAGTRAQQAINQQMLDASDLVIAIFWRRIGTPTGLAESGSVEEVQRAVARGVRVMVYFSDLEAPASAEDDDQLTRLQGFRTRVMANGLASKFSSRRKFEADLSRHLELAVAELIEAKSAKKKAAKKVARKSTAKGQGSISQSGSNNTQIVGNNNTINSAPLPAPKIVIGPLPGQVSPKDQRRMSKWVEDLAELSLKVKKGKDLGGWKKEYWSRLLRKFEIPRYNALMSDELPRVEQWYHQQKAMLSTTRKGKRSGAANKTWTTSIKTRMKAMGLTKEAYYPDLARRIKIDPFTSLTHLSSKDLERVYRTVLEDSKNA